MPAAEIRDHETGLVSEPFSWFQSRQTFCETQETSPLVIKITLKQFHEGFLLKL